MAALVVIAALAVLPAAFGADCSPGYKLSEAYCSSSASDESSCAGSCCTLSTPYAECSAGSCSPGYKKKSSLTGLTCSTSLTTADYCNGNCCELDTTKCAGATGSCAAGKYYDATSHADTTATTYADNCCTDEAACLAGTCAAGFKKKSVLTDLYCSTSATDATYCNTNCCEADTDKCGGVSSGSCAAGKYYDSSSADTAVSADYATDCCTDQATCAAGSCAAGYKKKSSVTDLYCDSSATDATSCNNNCCELDSTKCASFSSSVVCADGKVFEESVYDVAATSANQNTQCCADKAACSSYTCPAGMMTDTPYCSSSATDATSCNSACCEMDQTKCLYLRSPSDVAACAAGKYYLSATMAGNAETTAAACCGDLTTCDAGSCSSGYKKKGSLSGLYCDVDATGAALCDGNCCEVDATTCGGLYAGTTACPAGKYYNDGAAATTADSGTFGDNCCTAQAECSTATCNAGYKLKDPTTDLYCSTSASDGSSCNSNCCDSDDTKCLHHSATSTCDAGKYYDATTSAGTDGNAGNFATACCSDQAACSSGTCAPGMKKKSSLTGLYCTTSSTDADTCTNCCEVDDTKCYYFNTLSGADGIECATGKYYDSSTHADTAASSSNKDTNCCTDAAACQVGGSGGSDGSAGSTSDARAAAPGVAAMLVSVMVLSGLAGSQ